MSIYARHGRFLIALALGVAVVALTAGAMPLPERGLVAFDTFALTYLLLTFWRVGRITSSVLRRKAETDDEGMPLIVLLTMGAVGASIVAIWLVLDGRGVTGAEMTLALSAVPLGWAVVHTVAAFHYAHLHYSPDASCRLDFPDQVTPEIWDFLYFAFVIGMTAQTSDVTIASVRMRRAVLAHSVASFFYNTVILALAVNAGAQLGG
jgi:uncharacterized membrane protein